MTDTAKATIEWLRTKSCDSCIYSSKWNGNCVNAKGCIIREAADLVERYATMLDIEIKTNNKLSEKIVELTRMGCGK